jgi:hypothetical protein
MYVFVFYSRPTTLLPKDLALLEYKNIHGEYLIFERVKSERTASTDPKPITIYINPDMWATIEEFGNKDKNPEDFIFPILHEGIALFMAVRLGSEFHRHYQQIDGDNRREIGN